MALTRNFWLGKNRLYLFGRTRTKIPGQSESFQQDPLDRVFFTYNPKKIFKSYHLVALLNILSRWVSCLVLKVSRQIFDAIFVSFRRARFWQRPRAFHHFTKFTISCIFAFSSQPFMCTWRLSRVQKLLSLNWSHTLSYSILICLSYSRVCY